MTRTTGMARVVGLLMVVAAATACSDRAERKADDAASDAAKVAEKTGDVVAAAAKDAGGAAVDAARATGEAAKDAARATGDLVKEGGRAAGAAVETMDVKVALTADARVDASDINVDSDHATRTVTLRGSVPTEAQKTLAEAIATARATGYHVSNKLVVARKR